MNGVSQVLIIIQIMIPICDYILLYSDDLFCYRHDEELVAKIKRRVALEEKAYRTVVMLTESTPTENVLRNLVSNQQDFTLWFQSVMICRIQYRFSVTHVCGDYSISLIVESQ